MPDWFSMDNWPPTALTGLHPVVDVEDISMVNMQLEGGIFASYQQCHFTPDYWRNYTVIGTEGRIENFGDVAGSEVKLWNRRACRRGRRRRDLHRPRGAGCGSRRRRRAARRRVPAVRPHGGLTETSPVAAREAVAAGILATASLRGDGSAIEIPSLDPELVAYFERGQVEAALV